MTDVSYVGFLLLARCEDLPVNLGASALVAMHILREASTFANLAALRWAGRDGKGTTSPGRAPCSLKGADTPAILRRGHILNAAGVHSPTSYRAPLTARRAQRDRTSAFAKCKIHLAREFARRPAMGELRPYLRSRVIGPGATSRYRSLCGMPSTPMRRARKARQRCCRI